MSQINTRLRVAASKDLDLLLSWVNNLRFKIEIKGNPVIKDKKWNLFFVLPESDEPTARKMPLIINLD